MLAVLAMVVIEGMVAMVGSVVVMPMLAIVGIVAIVGSAVVIPMLAKVGMEAILLMLLMVLATELQVRSALLLVTVLLEEEPLAGIVGRVKDGVLENLGLGVTVVWGSRVGGPGLGLLTGESREILRGCSSSSMEAPHPDLAPDPRIGEEIMRRPWGGDGGPRGGETRRGGGATMRGGDSWTGSSSTFCVILGASALLFLFRPNFSWTGSSILSTSVSVSFLARFALWTFSASVRSLLSISRHLLRMSWVGPSLISGVLKPGDEHREELEESESESVSRSDSVTPPNMSTLVMVFTLLSSDFSSLLFRKDREEMRLRDMVTGSIDQGIDSGLLSLVANGGAGCNSLLHSFSSSFTGYIHFCSLCATCQSDWEIKSLPPAPHSTCTLTPLAPPSLTILHC